MNYALSGLFILSIILQSTLFSHLTLFGIKPDIVTTLVVLFSMIKGPKAGAKAGLVGGLLQDIMFGQFLGLNTLTKMFTGYLFGLLERKIYKDNFFIPIVVVFAGTFVSETIFYVLRSAVLPTVDYFSTLRRMTLYVALYNCLITAFIYPRFYKSSQKGWLRSD